MEASSFIVKHGKNNAAQFENDAFSSFLQCYLELQLIDGCPSKPSAIKLHKEYWAYLIGQPNDDPRVKSFSSQLSSKVLPPTPDKSNTHRIALKDFAQKLVHKMNKQSINKNNGGGATDGGINATTPSNSDSMPE
jgi:hypothetical protein